MVISIEPLFVEQSEFVIIETKTGAGKLSIVCNEIA